MEKSEQGKTQQAFIEGRQAGNLLLPPSLNPYPDDSQERAEWERGRFLATRAYALRRVA